MRSTQVRNAIYDIPVHTVVMAASNHRCSVNSPEESFLLSIYHSLWRNRCVSVIVGLRIPDIICSSQKTSLSIDEIAAKSGCDSSKRLYPIMRLAAQWGIAIELENKHFAKNNAIELLRRDKGPSLGHLIEFTMGDECYTGLRSFAACVKHGKVPFVTEHGMTHTQYMSDIENCPYNPDKMYEGASKYKIGSDERRRELYDAYVKELQYVTRLWTLEDVPGVNNLFKTFPWAECKKIVDIGGSTGVLLASILKLPGCEHIQGYVVELPEVVDDAMRNIHDTAATVEQRIQFVKQDCFQAFPSELHSLNADTVMAKSFLSMFANDEEKMTKFFTNCRNLFPAEGGKVLVIDFCAPDAGDSVQGINGLELGAFTMHWMNIKGVHLLTKSEWVDLFNDIGNKLGYRVRKIHDTFDGGAVIFELCYKP